MACVCVSVCVCVCGGVCVWMCVCVRAHNIERAYPKHVRLTHA